MADKRNGPTPFRPHARDQQRLDYLKLLEANISQIIKDALTPYLDQHYDRLVRERKEELARAIQSAVPGR
jgi:hypothetical protein